VQITTYFCLTAAISFIYSTPRLGLRCGKLLGLLVLSCAFLMSHGIANAASVTTLQAGSGGSLVTSAGTWTFSTGTGGGGNLILLNGQSAANGSATEMLIANGGQVYVDNNAGNWYLWNGSGWTQSAAPLSPNNAVLQAGSGGGLVTGAGLWTFSTATGGGGNLILLNGKSAANGSAVKMLIANGGQVYVDNNVGNWYLWNGNGWTITANPLPASANGATITGAGQLIDGAGNIWTLSGGVVYVNGQLAGYSANVIELAYVGGVIYQENSAKGWWAWNGGAWAAASNPLPAVNGACGSANGTAVSAAPTANLCTAGAATNVAGNGPWTWGCNGSNGGTNASCSAPVLVTTSFTVTSPANGATVSGTINITGAAGTQWINVRAYNANGPISADATPSNGTYTLSVNTAALASGNNAIKVVAFSVPAGQSGATQTINLTLNVQNVVAVNGACGSANGTAVSAAPTANLCTAGAATNVAGNGPWTWGCNGSNGGTNASCSARVASASCLPTMTFPAGADIDSSSTHAGIAASLDYSLASLAAQGCPPVPDMPHGMNNTRNTGNIDAALSNMVTAHQTMQREGIWWEQVTDSTGALLNPARDLSAYDYFYANFPSRGLTLHWSIGSGGNDPPGVSFANKAAAYRTMATFMANMVARYPNVIYWELMNEPDQYGTSGGLCNVSCSPGIGFTDIFGSNAGLNLYQQGQNYAQMLAVVVPAMKAVNPNVKPILAGLAFPDTASTSFSQGVLDGGGAQYLWAWNIHVYGPIAYRVLDETVMFRTWMNANGLSNMPIVMTEWGDNTGPGGSTQQTAECAAYADIKKYGLIAFDEVYAFDDAGWSLFTGTPNWTPTTAETNCFMNNP
jgi:Cellulase (glycosyl hydrolase family 5)